MEESVQVIRIEPSKGWVALQLKELWAYRELLYFLIWRDVKVHYKQTALAFPPDRPHGTCRPQKGGHVPNIRKAYI